MTPIPKKVRKEISLDPSYKVCKLKGLHNHECGGRITIEHALIYAGRQIQEKWALVSVCAAGQEVDSYQDAGTMNKELNQWVALNQATKEDLERFPRVDFLLKRDRLNKKFGGYPAHKYVEKTGIVGGETVEINYGPDFIPLFSTSY